MNAMIMLCYYGIICLTTSPCILSASASVKTHSSQQPIEITKPLELLAAWAGMKEGAMWGMLDLFDQKERTEVGVIPHTLDYTEPKVMLLLYVCPVSEQSKDHLCTRRFYDGSHRVCLEIALAVPSMGVLLSLRSKRAFELMHTQAGRGKLSVCMCIRRRTEHVQTDWYHDDAFLENWCTFLEDDRYTLMSMGRIKGGRVYDFIEKPIAPVLRTEGTCLSSRLGEDQQVDLFDLFAGQHFSHEELPATLLGRLLHITVHQRAEDVLALLLRRGIAPNIPDHQGCMPLHDAARTSLSMVKLLVTNGADVTVRAGNDETPLHDAARDLQYEICSYLGAIDTRNFVALASTGDSPASILIKYGGAPAARILNRFVSNAHREQILCCAVAEKNFALALQLLKEGSDVNSSWKGHSVLYRAVDLQNHELVEYLLQHGADPTVVGKGGLTPWHLAQQLAAQDLCELFERYRRVQAACEVSVTESDSKSSL